MNLNDQFIDYFNQYQDMVYTLCLGYSKGDESRAQDLTQEVFVRVWDALPKFEGRSSPKTWIYRICVNTCLLFIRKTTKENFQKLNNQHLEVPEETSRDEAFSELYGAIGQLPELDRIIILLVLEEVSYDEIAEITGLSNGNLRVKISRIKQKLNKLLGENGRSF